MAGVPAGRLNIEIVAEIARLQADLDKAKRMVKGASDDIARSAKVANDNLEGMAGGVTRTGNASRLASYQVQNLAYQLEDMIVGLSSGQKPLTVFMQQGSQIGGVMMQAGIGVRGLITELIALAAPFAPIIAAIAIMGAGLALVTNEINKNSAVHVTWKDVLLGVYDALRASVTEKLTAAFSYFGVTTSDVWGKVVDITKWAINWIIGGMTMVPRVLLDTWKVIPSGVADIFLSTVNTSIDAVNWLIRKTVDGINAFIGQANTILNQFGMGLKPLTATQIDHVANSYTGAGAKLGNALAKSITDTVQRDFIGEMASAISPYAQARARARLDDDAQKAGKSAGSKLGKAMAEAASDAFDFDAANKKLVDKTAADAAAEAAKNADDEWTAFQQTLDNWSKYTADEAAMKARKMAEELAVANDQIRNMIGLLGNMGSVGGVLGGLLGIASGNTGAIGGKIGQILNIGVGTTTDAQGRAVARTIGDELGKIFDQNGKFAKTMTSILQGAGTGMIAADAFGVGNSSTEKIGSALGGALGKVAGDALGKAVGGALGSAMGPIGSIVGGVLGGVLGGLFKTTKYGGATITNGEISKFGNSGSRADAGATMAGSVVNGLSSIADKLGATVGAYNLSIGMYKDKYRVSTTGSTKLGGYSGSEAQNEAQYGLYNFGQDAEAAVKFAIATAIKQGALEGLRAGTQALLQKGTDIEVQLQKALQFEGVFSDLKAATDPMGYALDNVTKQFDALRKIFDEAGASTAEYAQLEQLLAIKRQEAVDGAMQDMVSKYSDQNSLEVKILDLLGRSEDSLAASRLAELAATKQSLQPMQAMVYQLEDLNGIVDKFGPLSADLKAFKKELLGGDATTSFATLSASFRTTASAAASGDATAMGNLRGVSQDYLDAAMANASSATEYQRALGDVLRAVDQGIFAADTQVDYAQAQIDAINANLGAILDFKEEMATYQMAIVEGVNSLDRLWKRFEGDGLTVKTDTDTPLQVEVI